VRRHGHRLRRDPLQGRVRRVGGGTGVPADPRHRVRPQDAVGGARIRTGGVRPVAARRGDVTMLDFSDQVVLVTGAGSGIGAAGAARCGRRGGRVVGHYGRNREGAEKVASSIQEAGGRGSVVQADLTDPASATRLVDDVAARHGRLDVLVNNAGDLLGRTPVTAMTDEQFARVMDLNMTSVFAACRQAVPVMQRNGGGAIVNVTSVAARTGGAGGSVAYATAKGAVSTFTRGLAKEVARTGIRVNA